MLVPGEARPESAGVLRWVAECSPDDFGVLVGQRAFSYFPHQVRNGRCFVEDQQQAFAFVVQAGECLGVALRPGHGVDAPVLFVLRIRADQRRSRQAEPMGRDRQAIPLRNLWPGLGPELRFGVCRNDATGVDCGVERPLDDP
ncbi:hypothetical protein D3C84_923540 [compost metagenome]